MQVAVQKLEQRLQELTAGCCTGWDQAL